MFFAAHDFSLRRAAAWSAACAIVMMAISISMTQIFVGFTMLFFVLHLMGPARSSYGGAGAINSRSLKRLPPPPLVAGFLLFSLLLVSMLVHLTTGPNPLTYFGRAARGELSDLPLFLFGFIVYLIARDERDGLLLRQAIWIFALILILSGLVALFTEFRLAKILTGHGFIPSVANRPQHPAFALFGIRLYRPIGFMNTRLTYAGLLVMILPFLLVHRMGGQSPHGQPTDGPPTDGQPTDGLQTDDQRPDEANRQRNGILRAVSPLLFLAGVLLLFMNNTRSAQLGMLPTTGAALLLLLPIRRKIFLRFAGVLVIMVVLFLAGVIAAGRGERGLNLIRTVLLRDTDAFRPIIWSGSGALIMEHPLFGVGPGNFEVKTLRWRDDFVLRHPRTWYFVQNTPRGHAHNDLLHLSAVGGLPAGLTFLALISLIVLALQRSPPGIPTALLLGALALFPAGLFQCYFQDDEVIVLFWVLLAIALSRGNRSRRSAPAD